MIAFRLAHAPSTHYVRGQQQQQQQTAQRGEENGDNQKRIAGWLAHGPKEQQRLGIRLFTLLYAYSKPCWRAKFRCAMTTVETNSTLFVCQTKVHVEQWPLIVSQDLHRNFQKNCNATTSKRGTFIFFATARVTCYLNE